MQGKQSRNRAVPGQFDRNPSKRTLNDMNPDNIQLASLINSGKLLKLSWIRGRTSSGRQCDFMIVIVRKKHQT